MAATMEQLQHQQCKPCEGGVEAYSQEQTEEQLRQLDGWNASSDGKRIHKTWKMKDFVSGMLFLNDVADVAEHEGHHPDLHLEGYRRVRIELTTHAIGGLSENDFILAAKIDGLASAGF
jgi:4a-hydroxytetrahydrobiopterin dehydratase